MATFKVLTKDNEKKLISLGRTGAMKKVMQALTDITQDNGPKRNWGKFKEAFESFGFTVVYDRNLAILITALFAAVAHDKSMNNLAAQVIHEEVTDNKGQKITLGQALLDGYGKAIYKILNCQNFKTILKNMSISDKCITKFLNRIKKITPWRLFGSKMTALTIKEIFEQMTQREYYTPNAEEQSDIDEVIKETQLSINAKLNKAKSAFDIIERNVQEINKKITQNRGNGMPKTEYQEILDTAETLRFNAAYSLANIRGNIDLNRTHGTLKTFENETKKLIAEYNALVLDLTRAKNKTERLLQKVKEMLPATPEQTQQH